MLVLISLLLFEKQAVRSGSYPGDSYPGDGWWIVQMLPRCTRNQPPQLLLADADLPALISWPHEAPALQAARAQPDTGSVVDQHFEAVGRLVGEDVGTVLDCAASEALHDAGQQAVHTASHVGGR